MQPAEGSLSPLNQPPEEKDIRLLLINPVSDESEKVSCLLEHHATTENHWSLEWKSFVESLAGPVTPAHRLHWRRTRPGVPRYVWGDYCAISYTWGSRTELATISLNGYDVSVTANLERALRGLRGSNTLPSGCFLWVDALCINQDDSFERGLEVSRMQTIYTRSLETIVYLGSGDQAIEAALEFINVTDGLWEDPAGLQKAMAKYLQTASLEIWDQIVTFLGVSYWWRQWVMQEMAAGSEDKPMYYGRTSTKSSLVWSVFNYFNRRHRFSSPPSTAFWNAVEQHPEHYKRLLEVETFEKPNAIGIRKFAFTGDGVQKWNTYQILSTARKNHASDPRDCVYGLLGLLDTSLASKIKVDYNANENDIYKSFTKTVIETEKSMEILGQCDIFGSPSWVPRLNVNFPWYRHPHHEQEAPSTANAGRTAEVFFEERPEADGGSTSFLHTSAVLLDQLDGLSTANLETDYNNENRLYKGGYAEESIQSTGSNNAYGSHEALKEALWRTAGGNRDVVGVIPAPPDYSILLSTEVLQEQYHFNPFTTEGNPTPNPWAGWVRKNAEFKIAGMKLVDYFQSAGIAEMDEGTRKQSIKSGTDASKRFTNACWSRRIAVTDNGYLCSVPWYAKKGDVVAVIPGCSFTVLLRPADDRQVSDKKAFKVVSPCYLHGAMNGEIWAGVDSGKVALENVVLV